MCLTDLRRPCPGAGVFGQAHPMQTQHRAVKANGMWRNQTWQALRGQVSLPGILLFSASLTSSLLPRGVDVQGALSGCAFVFSYAIGAMLQWLWHYLGLRPPRDRFRLWLDFA